MAIASSGGHWIQLQRLRPAFDSPETIYVTVDPAYRSECPGRSVRIVTDANRWSPPRMLKLALQVLWLVLRERPDVVISTGAAPGLYGVAFGRLLGARTIWVDSVANAEEMSGSGKLARHFASLWLTQWAHLSTPGGPHFKGSVL